VEKQTLSKNEQRVTQIKITLNVYNLKLSKSQKNSSST